MSAPELRTPRYSFPPLPRIFSFRTAAPNWLRKPWSMIARKEIGESCRRYSVAYARPNIPAAFIVTISNCARLESGATVSGLRVTVKPPDTLDV